MHGKAGMNLFNASCGPAQVKRSYGFQKSVFIKLELMQGICSALEMLPHFLDGGLHSECHAALRAAHFVFAFHGTSPPDWEFRHSGRCFYNEEVIFNCLGGKLALEMQRPAVLCRLSPFQRLFRTLCCR